MRNVPQKTAASFLAFLFVTSLALAADPPWKGKPYQQWDDKDIQRVFSDSPWTRISTITRSWRPISEKDDIPNGVLDGGVRKLPTDTAHATESTVGGELNVNIFWASSRVMRAASARRSVLHGGQSVDVDAYAAQPQEEYQIVIQSADMAPFSRHDEKFFQENSYLEVRRTKLKTPPSHVVYQRDEKGQLVTTAIFFFPKKTASGEPTIGPDEKSVEFNCKLESTNLRVTFEPQKMVDNQGPAL